jgi:hypothetical protein
MNVRYELRHACMEREKNKKMLSYHTHFFSFELCLKKKRMINKCIKLKKKANISLVWEL